MFLQRPDDGGGGGAGAGPRHVYGAVSGRNWPIFPAEAEHARAHAAAK